jgi:hypothetical protein
MNPLVYFWGIERDGLRGDWKEGADKLVRSEEVDMKWPDPRDLAGPIKITTGSTAFTNIFCMYAYTIPLNDPPVDHRNFQFGDSFVFLTDTVAFLSRLETAAAKTKRKFAWHLVRYVDFDNFVGRPGEFRKDRSFSYQSEFRFALYSGDGAPYSLWLDSLEDITTEVSPLEQINELITFKNRTGG